MPPLLSARTCWRAGWASIALGVLLTAATGQLTNVVLSGTGSYGSVAFTVFSVVNTLTVALIPLGIALLVGAVVLRRIEHLTAALVASGSIEATALADLTAGSSRGPRRTADGDVDLDDVDDPGVVEHEPGVR